jgi:4-hydroxybenzoate polyprenyltransferase
LTHPYAAGTIFVATVVFSLLASQGVPDPLLFVRVVGVVALGQACVGFTNELRDMPQDRLVKPDRPLIDGRASPRVARVIAWGVGIGSLVLGLTFGWVGVLFSIFGTGAGLLYNFWLKGTVMSWLPYAISFSLLPLWPFAALDNWNTTLAWIWVLILPASIALNIAQSLSDIDDDRTLGVGGLAERLGRQGALLTMWVACGITIVLALVTAAQSRLLVVLVIAALFSGGLVILAAWHCHRNPGPLSWQRAWRYVAAAMGILGIGWFSAVL